jgi:hypothetical protein
LKQPGDKRPAGDAANVVPFILMDQLVDRGEQDRDVHRFVSHFFMSGFIGRFARRIRPLLSLLCASDPRLLSCSQMENG